jgi:tetratricopeptide (TPR) repeat protein
MGWIKSLLGRSGQDETDYDEEARALVNEGRFRDALTSFNLALKESPGDPIILQEIAMVYTRIGMSDEAAKTYRHVLRNTRMRLGRTTDSDSCCGVPARRGKPSIT